MGWFARLLGLEAEAHDVVTVNDANFTREVLESPLPVLVDVWSDGCGPCKLLEPVVMKLSTEFKGRVKVVELDAGHNPKTVARLRVSGTPTVVYFRRGKEVERVVGYRAGHFHRELISELLG